MLVRENSFISVRDGRQTSQGHQLCPGRAKAGFADLRLQLLEIIKRRELSTTQVEHNRLRVVTLLPASEDHAQKKTERLRAALTVPGLPDHLVDFDLSRVGRRDSAAEVVLNDPAVRELKVPSVRDLVADGSHDACGFSCLENGHDLIGFVVPSDAN
jgi:hypothetical protein